MRLSLCIACWLLVTIPKGAARTSLTEVVTDKDLRNNIQRWRDAQESYYLKFYERQIRIAVDQGAESYIVDQYTRKKLARVYLENRDVSRIVIERDLAAVMNASLADAIRGRYSTFAAFILSKASEAISIVIKNVQAAIQSQDCSIIPCPPDKCGPDCSEKAYDRFK